MKTNIILVAFYILFAQVISVHAQEIYKNTNRHEAYIPQSEYTASTPKNVILMIGDGMGINHLAATMYANNNQLSVTNMPAVGLVKTQSSNRFTTDSAASGTAYATGHKTYNGAIGVNPDTIPVQNIPEILGDKDFATGVVTTDNISGATPSVFFAHQANRHMYKEILIDLLSSPLTFVGGGCVEHFGKEMPEFRTLLPKHNFTLLDDYNAIPQCKKADKIALVTRDDIKLKKEGRDNFLPLTTRYAIDFLASKPAKSFFLMVEAAKIDKGGHDNTLETVILETLDFDKAVAEALKFADKNEETLVIVTADHETGGMSILKGDIASSELEVDFTTKSHSPVMVPVFAYGPGSERFNGVMENTEVMKIIVSLMKP